MLTTTSIDLSKGGSPQPGRLLEQFPPTAGAPLAQVIDGRTYITRLSADFASGTLVDVTDPDSIVEGLSIDGIPLFVARIR